MCSVNSPFRVILFGIFFRQLIMNVDSEKMINNLDDSKDNIIIYFQKIVILWVVQPIFCEMLIGGRKIVYADSFFEATNIRKNVQNDSSDFEGLIQEMMFREPFIN